MPTAINHPGPLPTTEALASATALANAVTNDGCPPPPALVVDFEQKMNVLIAASNAANGRNDPLLPTDGVYNSFIQDGLAQITKVNNVPFQPCNLTKIEPPPPPPPPKTPASPSTGLSTGAMVGIGLAVVAALALGAYFVLGKQSGHGRRSNPIAELGEGHHVSAARRRAGKKAWAKKKAEARASGRKSVKVGNRRVRI
jgi:hypothetical protein